MSASKSLVTGWNAPSPWTAQGREMAHVDRNTALQGKKSLARAELGEFNAQIRKRYTENRLHDAADVMGLALSLSQGDPLLMAGLMEITGEFLRTEQRAYRNTFGS